MATTRDRALDAALALVGEQGIRALTHARVDERAGLPKGSTSNWFRTRDALVAGVVTHLAESERADFAGAERPPVETPEQLIEALSAMVAAETGLFAARTRARFALFLEGAADPELLAPLLEQRRAYVEWVIALLARVGARSPAEASRSLMAAADGLVLHRVTVDPDAAIRPVIARAVRASLD
ncbi:TetR family transcriptional regulator [Microbacterium sp. SLBN-154]|uniref:TetR/AcrR family transcriptional regulator n=1 Tax=Microbacterium sp. SLBN-154 TaxID=2768458 RepID=UPI001151C1BE|nr:TetR family transcriptional regulator [Microbacterium sp. SLBN-154]TQK20184.1 TetR family transcriptional regulator [Microbacterium sp. SLBN-154]